LFTSGLTGGVIENDIIGKLDDWKLEPELLRGQAYDGAGAMVRCSYNTCIVSKYPKEIYTVHLTGSTSDIREVNNMMQTADSIAHFFKYSSKRQLSLENYIP